MRIALVDIDNTVVDMCGALRDYLALQGYTFIPENCIRYNFDGDVGVDKSIIFPTLKKPEMFELLQIYDGVVEAIDLLKEHCRVVAYTGTPDYSTLRKQRAILCDNLGFDEIMMFDYKKPVFNEVDVIFDDCLDVHKDWFLNANVTQYLINQPYNQEIHNDYSSSFWKKVIRCENFKEGVLHYLNTI